MRKQRKLPSPPAPVPPAGPSSEIPKWIPRDPYRPIDPGEKRVDFYEPSFVQGVVDKNKKVE